MKKILLSIALAAFLGGCFGASGVSAQWETAIACQTYATTLRGLTAAASQLTAKQIETVDSAKRVIHPICTGKKPGDNSEATLRLLQNALTEMTRVHQEAAK